ncbi:MAG: hypothetical protein ABSD44_09450 [Terracidiphilus sp.]
MRSFKFLNLPAFALLAFLFQAAAASAHAQGPAYLHAISDLRSAREYLKMDTRPETSNARGFALYQINRAIDDMQKAAIDDGKHPWQAPPPQSGGDPRWPIHSAQKLLQEARQDVARGRDAPENVGLQIGSLQHIDKALQALASF